MVKYLLETQAIRHIEFSYDGDPILMDEMVKVLKTNPWIRSVKMWHRDRSLFMPDKFKLFCENIGHYRIEEFSLANVTLPIESGKQLVNGLNAIQTIIKKLTFSGFFDMEGSGFSLLCQVLVSKKIPEFFYSGSYGDYKAFKQVLNSNYLQKWTAFNGTGHSFRFSEISDELKKNSSITDLTVEGLKFDWKALGEILDENKTIGKLHINGFELGNEILSLHLGSNKSIKELTLKNPDQLCDYQALFNDLYTNTTLRKLIIYGPVAESEN